MAETNGHAPPAPEPATATPADVDALLSGLFEATLFEVAAGRELEIRPLVLANADQLYSGELRGAGLQRYLLARCVYLGGVPLGDDGAARLPVALANRLVPVVMSANGMDTGKADDNGGAGELADPKAKGAPGGWRNMRWPSSWAELWGSCGKL